MKNLFLSIAALMGALIFSSCSKEELPASASSTPKVTFQFNVADPPTFGAGTKVVKTAWAEKDEILLLINRTAGSRKFLPSQAVEDISLYEPYQAKLTFVEGRWQTAIADDVLQTLLEGTNYWYVAAVHYPGSVQTTDLSWVGEYEEYEYMTSYTNGPLIVDETELDITDNGDSYTIGADISLEFYDSSAAQITVKDLDASQGYVMTIYKNNDNYQQEAATFVTGFYLMDSGWGTFNSTDSNEAIATEDGAAFYPEVENERGASVTTVYNFQLKDTTTDTYYYYSVAKDEDHTLTPGCAILLPSLDSWSEESPFK